MMSAPMRSTISTIAESPCALGTAPLDPNRLRALPARRPPPAAARYDDRGEVAGNGVAPARGRVRLSTVDDEARRTGRAVERVATVADRRGLDPEIVE